MRTMQSRVMKQQLPVLAVVDCILLIAFPHRMLTDSRNPFMNKVMEVVELIINMESLNTVVLNSHHGLKLTFQPQMNISKHSAMVIASCIRTMHTSEMLPKNIS